MAAVVLLAAGWAAAAGLSVNAGGGFSDGDDQKRSAVAAAGASFEWRSLQADYLFAGPGERRHFATVSWVRRARTGRARPFFQVGAGVADDSPALVVGAGVTVELGRSLFIRPQVRMYGHAGPTLTLLPVVAVGWRF